jgi:hypothetical protein
VRDRWVGDGSEGRRLGCSARVSGVGKGVCRGIEWYIKSRQKGKTRGLEGVEIHC